MVAAAKLKMQVELSFDDLLRWVDELPLEQKIGLLERLKTKAFRENWLALAQEIRQAGFSDDEILEEIKAVRRLRHAA